jgi:hypothetical protein
LDPPHARDHPREATFGQLVGFAVQLWLPQHPGFGLGSAEQLPEPMIAFVADQLGFADQGQTGMTTTRRAAFTA